MRAISLSEIDIMARHDITPLLVFSVFAFLDTLLTAVALSFWSAAEMNPVAAWAWRKGGFFALLAGKILLFLLLLGLSHYDKTSGRIMAWFSATIQILVVTITLGAFLL